MHAYRLLTGRDDSEFCHKVTRALNDGWTLYGSPSVTVNPTTGEVTCAQAVTKDVPDLTYREDLKLGTL